jgi:tetratricopeptide (TPR) repeat protein
MLGALKETVSKVLEGVAHGPLIDVTAAHQVLNVLIEQAEGDESGSDDAFARAWAAWCRAGESGTYFEIVSTLQIALTSLASPLAALFHSQRRQAADWSAKAAANLTRFLASRSIGSLDKSIEHFRRVIAVIPPGDENRSKMLVNLVNALMLRFSEQSDDRDEAEVFTVSKLFARSLPHADPSKPKVLYEMGRASVARYKANPDIAVLDDAIVMLSEALALLPPAGSVQRKCVQELWTSTALRFDRLGERGDLDSVISFGKELLAKMPASDPGKPEVLARLSNAFQARYQLDGHIEDLEAAIPLARAAVENQATDNALRPMALYSLHTALTLQASGRMHRVNTDDAILAANAAADEARPDSDEYADAKMALGHALMTRFQATGDSAAIDSAVEAFLDAAAAHPGRRDVLVSSKYRVVDAILLRYQTQPNREELDRAVDLWLEIVDLERTIPFVWADERAACAPALIQSLVESGDRTDIERAVMIGQHALAIAVSFGDRIAAGSAQCDLARILPLLAYHNKDQGLLDEAVRLSTAALQSASEDESKYQYHLTVGLCLLGRFQQIGEAGDIEQAIAGFVAALESAQSEPQRQAAIDFVFAAKMERYGATRVASDIDDLILTAQRGPDWLESSTRPEIARDLLRERYQKTERLEDLDAAIDAASAAVLRSTSIEGRALCAADLGDILRTRFGRLGRVADIDAAVLNCRNALQSDSLGRRAAAYCSANLATALQDRYSVTRDPRDLDSAIEAARYAVDRIDADPVLAPRFLSYLGNALQRKFDTVDDIGFLNEAVDILERCIALSAGDNPARGTRLLSVGAALVRRYSSTGDIADIQRSLQLTRESVAVASTDHSRAIALSGLGTVLLLEYRRTSRADELDEAIRLLQSSVDLTPAQQPQWAHRLHRLGNALRERFELSFEPSDALRAVDSFELASRSTSGTVSDRFAAATQAAWTSVSLGIADLAFASFSESVALLPLVAGRGLDRKLRELEVSKYSHLALEAAAFAIEAGQPERAVEWLEQGRSILWNQLLEIGSDLDPVGAQSPELAARMDGVRRAIDELEHGDASGVDRLDWVTIGVAASEATGRRRRQLVEEWEELVLAARRLPDLSDLFVSPSFDTLRKAAADGPVVIINVARTRCDALVVTIDAVRIVSLPGLKRKDAARWANTLFDALDAVSTAGGRDGRLEALQTTIFQLLNWLWEAVCRPILDSLGALLPSRRDCLGRVWWCPTGPLTALPLHAAGRYRMTPSEASSDGDDRADGVAERVVSSYATSLGAILRARTGRSEVSRGRQLAIGMPETPRLNPLQGVRKEIGRLEERVPTLSLVGSAATRQRVLDEISGHARIHFACHAGQDLSDPSRGAVYLHDGPLTVLQIAGLRQKDGDLVYLSACETAVGGTGLPDEAIHLAGAFQLAGYRHIVSTMWSINDGKAAEFAEAVYDELMVNGDFDPSRTGRAVHAAMKLLRQRYPRRPDVWAAYVHFGP